MRQGTGSDEHDVSVRLGNRITECPAQSQIVLRVGGLTHADRDPPLVGQALSQELPELRGGVEDRKMIIVNRGNPGALAISLGRYETGKLGIAEEFIRRCDMPRGSSSDVNNPLRR